MSIKKEIHINLLQKELRIQLLEWEKVLNQYAVKLFQKQELLLCKYIGIDEARGNVLLEFNHKINFPPRKNEHYTCFLTDHHLQHVKGWGSLQYKDLRTQQKIKFDAKVIFVKYSKETSIVGISGINQEQKERLEKQLLVFLGPTDPPLHYLQNLIEFLKISNENHELFNISINENNWNPALIGAEVDIVATLQTDLLESGICVIQGPPGTGKTYRMAGFINAVVTLGYSVMVTALTNRALIELAEKEQMRPLLEAGKVFKTNLTISEQKNKKIAGIKPLRKILQDTPSVLLTSYYTMSNIAVNSIQNDYFDYVIVEEASQAYLSTIALARKVGKKCILVGDIAQLPPIFHMSYPIDHPNNYHWMVNGLACVSASNKQIAQYILKDSFRLSKAAVNSTNVFYDDILTSKSDIHFPQNSDIANFFGHNGGIRIKTFHFKKRTEIPIEIEALITKSISTILQNDKKAAIAVLAFNRNTVNILSKIVYTKFSDPNNLTVDTIDRIQGLTTDFTLFVIPFDAFGGALNQNRFNVATSRARKGTLILADSTIYEVVRNSKKLNLFVHRIHVD